MNESILVVDDSNIARILLSDILTESNYNVTLIESGIKTLIHLKTSEPDLILLDIHLDDMSGLEVCRLIKEDPKTQSIPIILISGTANASEWVSGLQLGAADCVLKPFNSMELLARIHAQLALSETNKILTKTKARLELLNHTIDIITEGIYWVDMDGLILFANASAHKILGYELGELEKMSVLDISLTATKERWNIFFQRVKEQKNITVETIHKRKDGSHFPVEISSTYIHLGDIEYVNGFVRDITVRKQIEESLHSSQRQLHTFISNAPTAIAMLDKDLRYLAYSERWLEDYNLSRDQNLIGEHHYDIFPSIRTNEFWKDIHKRCLAGESIKKEEDQFIGNDGKLVWLRWDIHPWYLTDGNVGGIIMLTESITARKMAEMELAERNRFIESLMDLSPGIIYIYDIIERKNIYTNEGIQKILGYSAKEVQEMGNQVISLLMHPDDFKNYLENIVPKYVTTGDNEQIIHQYRMKHKMGIWRWLESAEGIYKRLADNTPKQIFGTVHDITERKLGEDALKSLATNFAKLSGKDFFREVSKHIAMVANLDCIFIGEFDPKKEKVIILGGYFLGEWLEMTYELTQTPCEKVSEKSFCFHPKSVQSLYPKDTDLVKMNAESYMGSPILNKQNEPIGLMVAIHSKEMTNPAMITTLFSIFLDRVAAEILRMKAEEALILEKEKAETYLNLVEVILIAFDDMARITLLNRKGHQVLGYEEGELIGRDWFKLCLPPEEYETVFAVYKKIMAGEIEPFEYYENSILTKSGETRWIAWHNSVIKNSEGKIVGTLSSGEDITERKKAEKELMIAKEKTEESERTLRAIYENSQDAIIITQNSKIAMVNQAYLDLLGFENRSEIIGRPFLNNISPKEHDRIKELHKKRNLGLDVPNFYETVGIRKNGEEFPFDVKVGNFEVNDQVFTIAIVRDITERKKSELELERHRSRLEELVQERTLELLDTIQRLKETQSQLVQSEKLASLGILTAGIAHEINNPVNYINSSIISLEILAKELIDIIQMYETFTPENFQDKLKEIEELKESINLSEAIDGVTLLSDNIKIGAKKTADIVRSLRLFSRTDTDNPALVDINENIDSTLILLHSQYNDRIEIIKEYERLPLISCFPGKLNQVFMNLLANAIQAIPEKGMITIKTSHLPFGLPDFKKESIFISIRDTGSGIPAEIRNKIFEPFFTTKDIGSGTGLGLAISYGIIEQHKGKMEFTSEVGKGSEFKIYLPVK